jgi:indolepyruvate ferredoxin oxidoreductase alpha subunit
MNRLLLLGDEAVAQAAIDAGISGVYAYPGTPSTEITEYIQSSDKAQKENIHHAWSANEKTAMEAAMGMSFCGKRSMVCMKHVGKRSCRSFYEFFHFGDSWGFAFCSRRRSFHALFAK